jgi:asparagine synthase (glutamine-hydrolysing)
LALTVGHQQLAWLPQIDVQSRLDGKHPKIEKYLLRKAFDVPEAPYLPESVLWRQKEQFSDGVGYSWVDGLKDYANEVLLFVVNPPP